MRKASRIGTAFRIRTGLAVSAVVVAGLLGLSACTSDGAPSVTVATTFASGTTMAKLHDAGTIRIGVDTDRPLFGLLGDDKVPVGFDAEIGKLIAGALGIAADKITWVPAAQASGASLIVDGTADVVVATLRIDDAGKAIVSFAGPYFIGGQDIVVAAGNPHGVKGPVDLKDKTVCGIAGSSYAQTIAGYAPAFTGAASYADCLAALAAGSVIAVTGDDVALAGLVSQEPKKFALLGNPFTAESYGIAIGVKDAKFRSFINDVLQRSFADGTWQKAWDGTAGTVMNPENPPILDRY